MKHETLTYVLLALVMVLVVCNLISLHKASGLVAQRIELEQEYKADLKLLERCEGQAAVQRRTATLLHELEPGDSLEVLGGLFEFRPSRKLLSGQPVIRWYIPGKVKPVVYDELGGRLYSWFDTQTKELQGPFDPEVQK